MTEPKSGKPENDPAKEATDLRAAELDFESPGPKVDVAADAGAPPASPSDDTEILDDVDVSDLLRQVFDGSDAAPPSVDIMSNVRQTLREESGGRYFNDVWSSSSAPVRRFLLTSVVMLAVAVLLSLLLIPYGLSPVP